MSEVMFKAIGQVRTQASETDIRDEGKNVEAELEIFPEFEAVVWSLSKGGVRNGKGSYRQRPVDSWSLK